MELPNATLVALAGLLLGAVFGATAQRTNFCVMGAVSDLVALGDARRFRAWLLAMAVAILGSQAIQAAGLVELSDSAYLSPRLSWLGALLGGALFGFGMVLAGGCVNRVLVRIGGGSVKALVAFLVVGLFAGMTMRGLFALPRLRSEAASGLDLVGFGLPSQGLGDMAAAVTGLPPALARPALAAGIAGALAIWCLKDAAFRRRPRDVAAGVIIGALIPCGWLATGVLGADVFDPVPLASFTFVGPAGDSLLYLMTFTGASLSFGVAATGGIVVGALAASLQRGQFRLDAFADREDLVRHLLGGALMGIGGVAAAGCTIGQGLSGMSTLAAGSLLAVGGIVAGGACAVRYLEEGSLSAAVRSVFARG